MTEKQSAGEKQDIEEIKTDLGRSSQSLVLAGVFGGIVVTGILLIAAWNKGYFTRNDGVDNAPKAAVISNIVYLDMGSIISAATRRFLDDKNKSAEMDPTASGKEFSNRLAVLLDVYKRAGIIVLDKHYVISAPDGHDITREVAAKLELTLE